MIKIDLDWLPTNLLARAIGAALGLTGAGFYAVSLERLAKIAPNLPENVATWGMIIIPVVLSSIFGVRNLSAYEADLSTLGLMAFLCVVPALATLRYLDAIGYDADGRGVVCFAIVLLCVLPTKTLALGYGLIQWQFEGFLSRRGVPV